MPKPSIKASTLLVSAMLAWAPDATDMGLPSSCCTRARAWRSP
jgi:hypothetical protein